MNPLKVAQFNAQMAGMVVRGSLGKIALAGGIGAGAALLAVPLLRSVFQGQAGQGGYAAGANGDNPMTQFDGRTGGTWKNLGYTLKEPIPSTINTMMAIADTLTFHKIPALNRARLQATSNSATDIGAKIARGEYDASFAANYAGDVIGGTLTPEEKAMLAMMDPKDRARYLLQKKMQEKAEMAALCSNLQGLRHQCAMTTIGNIR
jgi:hypothetical protein